MKKTNKLCDINFWASVVTIVSIFFALYVFWNDKNEIRENEKHTYLNQLESLRFELKKNNDVILKFFNRDKALMLEGSAVAHFRYSTSVINRLIAEGIIKNDLLLRNLDAIADNFNQVNRIEDLISLMGTTTQISFQVDREIYSRRIKDISKSSINLNDQIHQYLPKVISDLETHISNTKGQ